jgi:hypothetical protein
MGEQSSSRLKGDDYQHLYSWYELLQLLDPNSPYSHGFVEHPNAGAADDVTLHSEKEIVAKYTQVKFHVDHTSQYSSTSVTEIPAGSTRSVLQKLFDSWKRLREEKTTRIEIWLVSNWASAEDIGRFLHDTCALKEEFFSGGSRSDAVKIRTDWRRSVGATEEDLHAFCRSLRLRLGYSGFQELEEKVDDRMARYGLRFGKDPRAIALDTVRTWIKEGGEHKRIDRAALEALIRERHLRATPVEQPRVSLWIHGWAKRYYDQTPTIELDWTSYFQLDSRTVATQSQWEKELFPQLRNARGKFAAMEGGTYIDFRGKLPLTASLAVGFVFSEGFGARFRVEQPSGGETLFWRSDAGIETFELEARETPLNDKATEGIVALSITGDATPDIERLVYSHPGRFRAILSLSPKQGPSATSIRTAGEASSVATHTKEELRRLRREHGLSALHLVLYSPSSVALFLGQRMNALGTVLTWERSPDGSYQPSVTLLTG